MYDGDSPFRLARGWAPHPFHCDSEMRAQTQAAFASEALRFAPVLQHVVCHQTTSDSISRSYCERGVLTFTRSGFWHLNFNTFDLIQRKSCWWSEPSPETEEVHLVTQTWFLRSFLDKCVQFSNPFLVFHKRAGLQGRTHRAPLEGLNSVIRTIKMVNSFHCSWTDSEATPESYSQFTCKLFQQLLKANTVLWKCILLIDFMIKELNILCILPHFISTQ